jgi:cell fate regulator YaaT (PSP1 superfamily)
MPDLLYKLTVNDAIKLDCIGADSLHLKRNDWCIAKNDRYQDNGRVTWVGPVPDGTDISEMPRVQRRATLVDQGKANENNFRSKSLHRSVQQRIDHHKLDMDLRSTHLTYDRKRVICVFTAEHRVDFRDLVKDLNHRLDARVELRHVGWRDYAGIVGGMGSCGRELCCSSFLTNFTSINLKMAKVQGASLNPSSLNGLCGRLKCCLDYEYEGYQVLLDKLPRIGERCTCEGCGSGRVIRQDALKQEVTLQLEDSRIVTVPADQVAPLQHAARG